MTTRPTHTDGSAPCSGAGGIVLSAFLSLLVIAATGVSGGLCRIDGWIVRWHQCQLGESTERLLPVWSIVVASVLVAVGAPVLMMGMRHAWQRWVWWLSSLVLTAAWAPVLALCAYRPEIAAPWVGLLVGGGVAMICAGRWGRR